MEADPFSSWRQPTGRTGSRGDYTDGAPQGHKKIAADYAANHRPKSHAAKYAINHPGADPSHYNNRNKNKNQISWNKDPVSVSWSGNTLPMEVQNYDLDALHHEMIARNEKLPHPEKTLEGTWDRNENIAVHQNRSAIMRKMVSTMTEEPTNQQIGKTNVISKISLATLKKSPGLPFYTPREPTLLEKTNNSARLRAEHGKRSRKMHNHYSGRSVRTVKNGVRNLDVRQWVDNLDTLTSPRAYWNYTMHNNKKKWCNT